MLSLSKVENDCVTRLYRASPPASDDVQEGEEHVKVFPPAFLAQAIQFLEDNGIDQPARSGSKVDTLKGLLPDSATTTWCSLGGN